MSYRRKFYFGSCPECHDDVSVYTEVECLALKFDNRMEKRVEQTSPTLWINGLRLLNSKSGFAVPPYDAIVVDQVEDHDIEKFILTTQNQVFSPKHKPPPVYG
jgi:hypothetical protein